MHNLSLKDNLAEKYHCNAAVELTGIIKNTLPDPLIEALESYARQLRLELQWYELKQTCELEVIQKDLEHSFPKTFLITAPHMRQIF